MFRAINISSEVLIFADSEIATGVMRLLVAQHETSLRETHPWRSVPGKHALLTIDCMCCLRPVYVLSKVNDVEARPRWYCFFEIWNEWIERKTDVMSCSWICAAKINGFVLASIGLFWPYYIIFQIHTSKVFTIYLTIDITHCQKWKNTSQKMLFPPNVDSSVEFLNFRRSNAFMMALNFIDLKVVLLSVGSGS